MLHAFTMKLCYVIGPYRSKEGVFGIKQNIENAEKLALELWKQGFAVICPHKNTAFFDGTAHDDVWLQGDLEILKRCDFAVTVNGWESSVGGKNEVEFCKTHGIPVYHSVQHAVDAHKS
jgi:hypothetical protein